MPLKDFANRDEVEEQTQVTRFTERFILRPEYWENYSNPVKLRWRRVRAGVRSAKHVPLNKMGVYSFVVDARTASHPAAKYLLYVGKAQDQPLRRRFRQYLAESKDPKGRTSIKGMFRKWPGHLWFYFAEVDALPAVIHHLEADLIGAFVPPRNEVLPVEIRRPVKAAWFNR